MVEAIEKSAFEDALLEFVESVKKEHATLSFDDFDKWRRECPDEYRWFRMQVWDEYSVDYDTESQFSNSGVLIEDTDLSEEEIVTAIESWEKRKENPGGRPSKVEVWAEKIHSGEVTLEEAQEELAHSTFYKMKREFDFSGE